MRSLVELCGSPAGTKLRLAVLAASLVAAPILVGCGSKEPASTATASIATAATTTAATTTAAQAPIAASEAHTVYQRAEEAPVDDHAAHAADIDAPLAEPAHVHDASRTLPAQPFAELSGDSLHHLKSAWTDQHQEAVSLPELAGGPAVVVMFYGDCTTACPLLVKAAEDIEAALPRQLRDSTSFVMVSFDTERDTPSRLRDYAASKGLDRDGWHWLVGTPLQTRQLATMLGVQYREAGNGMWAHSNIVSVLDEGGVPVARLEGLGVDLAPAIAAIAVAAGR